PKIDINAAMVVFVGANPVVSQRHTWAITDPVMNIRKLKERGQVWVVDPRATETAHLATSHLQLRAGSDHALFAHAVRELLEDGADWDYLERHATDVDVLREAVAQFDLATAAEITGLDSESISAFVAAIRRAGRVALMSGTGLTFSASPAVAEWLMRALEVVTGSSDQPGGVWFSPNFYRQNDLQNYPPTVASPGPGPSSRPELPSWMGMYPCAAFPDEVETGALRAFFAIGGNPIAAFPERARVVEALEALDIVVVADIVDSDTAAYATHVLPCASQLERADLTLASTSAVYAQYTPPVVPVGAGRRTQWQIFAQLAQQLGHDLLPRGLSPEDCTTEDVLEDACAGARAPLAELVAHATGILAEPAVFGWARERVLPDGRWQVAPRVLVEQLAALRVPSATVYVPRRPRDRVNSTLRELSRGIDPDCVYLNPDDAHRIDAAEGDLVRVTSKSGSVVAPVVIDDGLRLGTVSIHHASDGANVCDLTSSTADIDPVTGMVLQSGIPVELTLAG
ncbi:MAG: molybdopterin-dependent oxidoreductase, partial [Ilumatobacteraceae bacterium]